MEQCNNCEVMALLKEKMNMDQPMEDYYIKVGKAQMKLELIESAENGTPIELQGRAWFLKSDIQNLRDIFEDIQNEEKDDPDDTSIGVVKQELFDCAANLTLTDKPKEQIADDIMKCLAKLDKFKLSE